MKIPSRFMTNIAPLVPYVTIGIGLFGIQSAWIALLSYHIGIALILTLDRRWSLAQTLIKGWHTPLIIFGVVFGVTSGSLIYVLWPLLARTLNLRLTLSTLGLQGLAWSAFAVYYFAINPWFEELYWRGYLGSETRSLHRMDMWFAGYHLLVLGSRVSWLWLALSFIALIVAAWLWRQLARICGGLLVPAVSHTAADASIMLALYTLSTR